MKGNWRNCSCNIPRVDETVHAQGDGVLRGNLVRRDMVTQVVTYFHVRSKYRLAPTRKDNYPMELLIVGHKWLKLVGEG